ncbi:MAG: PEP-CTERM sorting domain-containing protein [Pirellulales bacterium]|nr:PEP-CTERM sorting domain-containing protein [Pirellulales bacterium]
MMYKPIASILAVSCITMLLAGGAFAFSPGDTIVGDVFVAGIDGWADPYVPIGTDVPPNWGLLLGDDQSLSESNNEITGSNTSTRRDDAMSQTFIKTNSTTPSVYTLSAKVGTWDDDGYGLVFGYADESNYFRVGVRQQTGDSYGFSSGITVHKVVAGVHSLVKQDLTCVPSLPYNNGMHYDLSVTVDGTTGAYSVKANPAGGAMVEYLSGTDTDLANMAVGHYGVHSWAQDVDASAATGPCRERGTLIEEIAVASTTLNETTVFADALPVAWRALEMTNADGVKLWGTDIGQSYAAGEDYGNFRLDFHDGKIKDDTNGYEWASSTAANVDFTGPAIVIDEPGNGDWTNYEVAVRAECGDNEGPGVLVRVQDDNTFYRVQFTAEVIGTSNDRAPQGMSIQKCVDDGAGNAVWSELYREDQAAPLFIFSPDQAFDVKVAVTGATIKVSVIDDPDGAATPYSWTVVDATDPILSGSVGLHNWGGSDVTFSAYGGQAGTSLVTAAVPEPTSLVLLSLLALVGLALRRR